MDNNSFCITVSVTPGLTIVASLQCQNLSGVSVECQNVVCCSVDRSFPETKILGNQVYFPTLPLSSYIIPHLKG